MKFNKLFVLFVLSIFLTVPVAFAQEAGGIAVPPEAVDDNVLSSDGVVGSDNPHNSGEEDPLSDQSDLTQQTGQLVESVQSKYGTGCSCDVALFSALIKKAYPEWERAHLYFFAIFLTLAQVDTQSFDVFTINEATLDAEVDSLIQGDPDHLSEEDRADLEEAYRTMFSEALPVALNSLNQALALYEQAEVERKLLLGRLTKCNDLVDGEFTEDIKTLQRIGVTLQKVIDNAEQLKAKVTDYMNSRGILQGTAIAADTADQAADAESDELNEGAVAVLEFTMVTMGTSLIFGLVAPFVPSSLNLLRPLVGPRLLPGNIPAPVTAPLATPLAAQSASAVAEAAQVGGVIVAGAVAGQGMSGEVSANAAAAEANGGARALAAGEGTNAPRNSGGTNSNSQGGVPRDEPPALKPKITEEQVCGETFIRSEGELSAIHTNPKLFGDPTPAVIDRNNPNAFFASLRKLAQQANPKSPLANEIGAKKAFEITEQAIMELLELFYSK
jgi:hypothetical protein